ncbi:MAG: hypothetical protein LBM93_10615 [Oscillospiraceae bacterium]|jgi:hypothetical protein|nr:hypothetical protein [Oscillospiraceae bacterium]
MDSLFENVNESFNGNDGNNDRIITEVNTSLDDNDEKDNETITKVITSLDDNDEKDNETITEVTTSLDDNDEDDNETITEVKIYLDDNVPDYMSGIQRIGSVQVIRSNGTSDFNDDLVDNTEFSDERIDDMINYVASKLECSEDIISVEE